MNCKKCFRYLDKGTEKCKHCGLETRQKTPPIANPPQIDTTMYCEHCGKKIKNSYKFCTKCGNKLSESMHAPTELTKEQIKSLHGFSVGFLFFPFFYSASMKFSLLEILGALVLQGLVNWTDTLEVFIFYFVIAGYLSFKVRKYSYNGRRKWESFEQFMMVQKNWDIAAIVIVGLLIIIYALLGV